MSCNSCQDMTEAYEALVSLVKNAGVWDKFINGGVNETVTVAGNITIPTLRGWLAAIDERNSTAAEEAIAEGVAHIEGVKNYTLEVEKRVNATANTIKNTTATATPLQSGEAPTADYDSETGLLSLGIPAGPKGDTGQPGPPGTAPVMEVLDGGGAYESGVVTELDGGHAVNE